MSVNVRSRYWSLAPVEVDGPDGRVASLPIRPQSNLAGTTPVRHVMTAAENVEYLAWRFYGRSAAWWQIADANPLAFPLDYRTGAPLDVPQASGIGRVLRTRSF